MEYEINKETLAVIPISRNKCKIIENENEYILENDSFNVIEHSCEYFGSNYEGRYIGTKKIAGITHKSPIIIEDSTKIIFFPTTSPLKEDCIWISLNNISKYISGNLKGTSKIIFKNGSILDLDMSIGSLNNQILRASRLKYLLEERQKNLNK